MKKTFFVLASIFCLFSFNVLRGASNTSATETTNLPYAVEDSIFRIITEKSKLALNKLVERNNAFTELGQTDSLQFVLTLNFDLTDGADVPYFSQNSIGTHGILLVMPK